MRILTVLVVALLLVAACSDATQDTTTTEGTTTSASPETTTTAAQATTTSESTTTTTAATTTTEETTTTTVATTTTTLPSGGPTASCVNGWVTPTPGTALRTDPLDMIRGFLSLSAGDLFVVDDMRYFVGPEDVELIAPRQRCGTLVREGLSADRPDEQRTLDHPPHQHR